MIKIICLNISNYIKRNYRELDIKKVSLKKNKMMIIRVRFFFLNFDSDFLSLEK